MIKVLCETMTNSYDSSCKIKVIEFSTLEEFKKEIMKHFPKIHISFPDNEEKFWYGIQYGDTEDGFWFRWLYAIMDTNRGCLYSNGNTVCFNYFALPQNKQHCSKEVFAMLQDIDKEVKNKKQDIVFVD